MWILSRQNSKTVQKFNAQYVEMRLLAYRSVPLSVPCVFWKFEVRERLGLTIGGGGTVFPCVLWHFNHWHQVTWDWWLESSYWWRESVSHQQWLSCLLGVSKSSYLLPPLSVSFLLPFPALPPSFSFTWSLPVYPASWSVGSPVGPVGACAETQFCAFWG